MRCKRITTVSQIFLFSLLLIGNSYALTQPQLDAINQIANITNTSNVTLIGLFESFYNSTYITENFYNKSSVNNNFSEVFYDKNTTNVHFVNYSIYYENMSQINYRIDRVNNSVDMAIIQVLDGYQESAYEYAQNGSSETIKNFTKNLDKFYLTREAYDQLALNNTQFILQSQTFADNALVNQTNSVLINQDNKMSGYVVLLLGVNAAVGGGIYISLTRKKSKPTEVTVKEPFRKHAFERFGLNEVQHNENFNKDVDELRKIENYIYTRKIRPEQKTKLLDLFRKEGRITKISDVDEEIKLIQSEEKLYNEKRTDKLSPQRKGKKRV